MNLSRDKKSLMHMIIFYFGTVLYFNFLWQLWSNYGYRLSGEQCGPWASFKNYRCIVLCSSSSLPSFNLSSRCALLTFLMISCTCSPTCMHTSQIKIHRSFNFAYFNIIVWIEIINLSFNVSKLWNVRKFGVMQAVCKF